MDQPLLLLENRKNIKIYVVTHKNFVIPEYILYDALWCGNSGKCEIQCNIEKNALENIAYLNAKINECTGLYWIWKNTSERIVGLNHYRRYFKGMDGEEILGEQEVLSLLETYDFIVAEAQIFVNKYEKTIYEQLERTIDKEAFLTAYKIVRDAIAVYQPNYIEAFDTVMNGYAFFPCNMFITRRNILNEYCSWLFSFLIPAAEAFDDSPYDSYSRRAVGFFAERMLTVWLMRQDYRVKELPILNTEM